MPISNYPSPQPSPAWRLPVELLLLCLLAADMSSRIRASHVCHVWREAALVERRLWDTFACTRFRDKHHRDTMFALLQAMLLRSRSLPFDLEIPFDYDGNPYEYRDRLLALDQFDILRLKAYHGPASILSLLNPLAQPLTALLCLDNSRGHEGILMDYEFSSHCLPNLRHLIAPYFCFPEDGSPFVSLRSITSMGANRDFFSRCPNLSRLEITDTHMGSSIPRPPLPLSLRTLVVRCQRPSELDFTKLMEHWRGIRVRCIITSEVSSLHGVLPLFLASHTQPVKLRLTTPDQAVTLAAVTCDETNTNDLAPTVWTLGPSLPGAVHFLSNIEKPASDRLTSVSVSFARLDALFRGQLHLPGLESLEIILGGAAPTEPGFSPPLSGDVLSLRAPGLRQVAFTFDDEYAHPPSAHIESCQAALATLRDLFRALISYDAGLLDAILVSREIERECAGFAPLAKEYILVPRGSCGSA